MAEAVATATTTSACCAASSELTDAGLNLAGVKRVLELEDENARLRAEVDRVRAAADEAVARTHRAYRRDLVPLNQAVTVFGRSASIFGDH